MDKPSNVWVALARRHRILAALLLIYLPLSAAELVRTFLYDRPRSYEAGFYPKETVQLDRGPRDFWWTRGKGGEMLRPLFGKVVRIPLYMARPDIPEDGIAVEILVNGEVQDEVTIYEPGWHTFDYYMPPLLGYDPWGESPGAMSLDGYAVLESLPGDEPFAVPSVVWRRAPDYVRVFREWGGSPGTPSVQFGVRVESVFVPAAAVVAASETEASSQQPRALDWRNLGVGLGEPLWLTELPLGGLGLFPWETGMGGRFAWTGHRASLRVPVRQGASRLDVDFRTGPVPSTEPLIVSFYWDGAFIESSTARWGQDWTRMSLEIPEILIDRDEGTGVLTVDVPRTWSPSRSGISVDGRELGVALRQPIWAR